MPASAGMTVVLRSAAFRVAFFVESLAACCHVTQHLRRCKARTIVAGKPVSERHKGRNPHGIDIAEWTTGIGREANTKDRAHVTA